VQNRRAGFARQRLVLNIKKERGYV